MKVFITGISRGIGKGLCEKYLSLGYEVYAIGRSNPFREVKFQKVDVSAFELLPKAIENLQMQNIDIAILNAGILGEIKDMKEWSIKELQNIMDINVWVNKVIIDNIHTFTKKIVAISSGAAVNGNKGWGGYSISKAALNMLISLYAKEIDSKIYALAPGVIKTDMVKKVISANHSKYPSLDRVESGMVGLDFGVERVIKAIDKLDKFQSGSFIDVRNFN